MTTMAGFDGVRAFVAAKTDADHQALHVHPLLSQLVLDDLTEQVYTACLEAQMRAFCGIEVAREAIGAHEDFTLFPMISALSEDLQRSGPFEAVIDLRTADEGLGALYVAHGSQFGRAVIRQAVKAHLPGAPRAYFDLPSDAALWRAFLRVMEAAGPERWEAILRGAMISFGLMRSEADAAWARLLAAHQP